MSYLPELGQRPPAVIVDFESLLAKTTGEGTPDSVPLAETTTPSLILSEVSNGVTRRGTSNSNARGGSDARRRRREWLVRTYRANRDVLVIELFHGPLVVEVGQGTEGAVAACRCYRCGLLLTADTVTVDRIKPGCQGGTYARSNIRPACGTCNSSTGATTRRK